MYRYMNNEIKFKFLIKLTSAKVYVPVKVYLDDSPIYSPEFPDR